MRKVGLGMLVGVLVLAGAPRLWGEDTQSELSQLKGKVENLSKLFWKH